MKLHIANTTPQQHLFQYWVPEVTKLQEQLIAPGSQIVLEADKSVLDGILAAHRRYGIVEAREAGRTAKFSGLCFQFDKPIKVDALGVAAERRHDFEGERANEVRTATVAAIHTSINDAARTVGLAKVKTSSEIEERQSPELAAAKGRALKQTLTVDEQAPPGNRRRA
jgi:hypothetical protein